MTDQSLCHLHRSPLPSNALGSGQPLPSHRARAFSKSLRIDSHPALPVDQQSLATGVLLATVRLQLWS